MPGHGTALRGRARKVDVDLDRMMPGEKPELFVKMNRLLRLEHIVGELERLARNSVRRKVTSQALEAEFGEELERLNVEPSDGVSVPLSVSYCLKHEIEAMQGVLKRLDQVIEPLLRELPSAEIQPSGDRLPLAWTLIRWDRDDLALDLLEAAAATGSLSSEAEFLRDTLRTSEANRVARLSGESQQPASREEVDPFFGAIKAERFVGPSKESVEPPGNGPASLIGPPPQFASASQAEPPWEPEETAIGFGETVHNAVAYLLRLFSHTLVLMQVLGRRTKQDGLAALRWLRRTLLLAAKGCRETAIPALGRALAGSRVWLKQRFQEAVANYRKTNQDRNRLPLILAAGTLAGIVIFYFSLSSQPADQLAENPTQLRQLLEESFRRGDYREPELLPLLLEELKKIDHLKGGREISASYRDQISSFYDWHAKEEEDSGDLEAALSDYRVLASVLGEKRFQKRILELQERLESRPAAGQKGAESSPVQPSDDLLEQHQQALRKTLAGYIRRGALLPPPRGKNAWAAYLRLKKIAPSDRELPRYLAAIEDGLDEKGKIAVSQSKWEDAGSLYRLMSRLFPHRKELWRQRLEQLSSARKRVQEEKSQAAPVSDSASAPPPVTSKELRRRLELAFRNKQDLEVIRLAQELISKQQLGLEERLYVAGAYKRQGRMQQAEESLREILAEHPHQGLAHLWLGEIYLGQKKVRSARPELLASLFSDDLKAEDKKKAGQLLFRLNHPRAVHEVDDGGKVLTAGTLELRPRLVRFLSQKKDRSRTFAFAVVDDVQLQGRELSVKLKHGSSYHFRLQNPTDVRETHALLAVVFGFQERSEGRSLVFVPR